MALEDPVSEAANKYLANKLVMRFNPDAHERAFAYLSLRESSESFSGSDADLTKDQLDRATENAVTFLREAERMARENGDETVTREIVISAWIKFCPGLFPFC